MEGIIIMKTNVCLGDTFENFLKEEGILEEVYEKALKTAIAYRLQEVMNKANVTQTSLAQKMGTSRAVVQRLLNPSNTSVTLHTLGKAAQALGVRLCISFEE
jgi:antitoxin HicB